MDEAILIIMAVLTQLRVEAIGGNTSLGSIMSELKDV